MNQKDAFKKVKRATVALVVADFGNPRQPFQIVGSGFCIDAAGIIVDCAHVIEAFMAKSIREQIAQGEADERNRGREKHVIGPVQSITPHMFSSSFLMRCQGVWSRFQPQRSSPWPRQIEILV